MANTEATQKELQEQLEALRKDVSDISQTVREMVAAYSKEGSRRLKKSAQNAEKRAREAVGQLEGEIERHPLSSVAISFGVGLLIGKILHR